MNCPHCNATLSPEQITKLWAQLSASKRTTITGGRNGGRKPGAKDKQPRKRKGEAPA